MLSRLIERLRGHGASKQAAKERLQLVLMHDREALRPDVLEKLRHEIIEAIARCIDIDRSGIRVDLHREGREIALTANIPVQGWRRTGGSD